MQRALLIVDVQNDFCPGGALAVPHGDRVVPVINRLLDRFPLVLSSQDWHPAQSRHFERWPVHCVQESQGAALHPDLQADAIQLRLYKGTDQADDGYSAFEATNLDLAQTLHQAQVDHLYLVGLATDYCVKATALDAIKAGFDTTVVLDAVAAVELNPGDGINALQAMSNAGVRLTHSSAL